MPTRDEERYRRLGVAWAERFEQLARNVRGSRLEGVVPRAWRDRAERAGSLASAIESELAAASDAERRAELASARTLALVLAGEARRHARLEALATGEHRRKS